MSRKRSFPPLVNKQSRTLILGSLPGVESLRQEQYYAHPRNSFWRIIYALLGGALFDGKTDDDYNCRCEFILSKGIALWDVCSSAERVNSADDKIVNALPNDVSGLLGEYPNIQRIVFNGRRAEKEYRRFFGSVNVPAFYAPSTSPALAGLSFEEKLSAWRDALGITD